MEIRYIALSDVGLSAVLLNFFLYFLGTVFGTIVVDHYRRALRCKFYGDRSSDSSGSACYYSNFSI